MRFGCDHCGKTIEAWDDGNPYYFDERGRKHYAYHPDADRERCVGNDDPHLCLACGRKFKVDSAAPIDWCPKCASTDICTTTDLDGKPCPFCHTGRFRRDPEFFMIS